MNTRTLLCIVAALAAMAGGCVAQVGPDEGTATSTTAERLGKTPAVDEDKTEDKTASPDKVVDPGSQVADGEQEGPWPVPWKGSLGNDPRHPGPDPAPQEPQHK
jgi:hypothetical protein